MGQAGAAIDRGSMECTASAPHAAHGNGRGERSGSEVGERVAAPPALAQALSTLSSRLSASSQLTIFQKASTNLGLSFL